MTTAFAPPRTTYREVFAERRFRLLLVTRTLGILGDSLRITTLSVLIFAATRSALLSALTFGVGFAPQRMLLGDLVVGRFLRPATREKLVAPLVLLLGFPLLVFGFSPSVVEGAGTLLLCGTGFAYGLGLQRAFLAAVPGESAGQAFGLLSSGIMTLQGVFPAAFGLLASATGIGAAMAAAGAATVLTAAWLGARRVLLLGADIVEPGSG